MKSDNSKYLFHGFLLVLLVLILFSVNNPVVYDVGTPKDISGSVEVAIQDQHTEIIDLKLTAWLDNITLLDNYEIGNTTIDISTTGYVPVVDDVICLKENVSFYQGHVLGVTSLGGNNYSVDLDAPLDFPYSVLGGCSIRNGNWAVNGNVTDPVIFFVSPARLVNVSWDITRVIFICIGDGIGASDEKPDLSSFMATEPLSNGVVFRSVNGITKNIFSAVDNFHLIGESYDLSIYDKNRFGFYGVASRRTFSGQDKNGVTIRLDSETNDRFELIIQDDLTDMEDCHAIAQGHAVER